jgi:hypothetical protein
MEQQLLIYIEQELKRGVSEAMIKKALVDAGWENAAVEEAFGAAQTKLFPAAVPAAALAPEKIISDLKEKPAADDKGKKNRLITVAAAVFGVVILAVVGLVLSPGFFEPSQPADQNQALETEKTDEGNSSLDENVLNSAATSTVPENTIIAVENGIDVATTVENGIDATTTASLPADAQERDARRMSDMKEMYFAQETWYGGHDKYYTCGLAGGDCRGKPFGYPEQIGALLLQAPQDPQAAQYVSKKAVCGKDYIYCGLNNAAYPQFFCYYAKLEGGGYYTASHAGNFHRSTPPKIFEECAAAD